MHAQPGGVRSGFCQYSDRSFLRESRQWERGNIMQIGSIVRTVHIAVPNGARGIVQRILGDMAMVTWYSGEPGASKELNTEPFFLEDLIDTGEHVMPAGAKVH
ncbi:hypothetical protein C7399_10155 [Paraburkholderia tropica]|uniref:Uncharacterized protein n=2 Tax=Burkholderiaceae TaxID=119060 RepID=A0AAQ1GER6_9BURK|nr:hypothetical protein [Paraburkholderia tropica]PXX20329.1 hypothetical protein C7400_10155 [Paraburkholderia tropica]PZW89407.1 hypothetical protein C7399_10155 [Paraburkholderia tropica]SEJ52272.1 hypothetical protein SAMN05216550_105318 [Paraburkholderia tropica]